MSQKITKNYKFQKVNLTFKYWIYLVKWNISVAKGEENN